MKGELDAIVVGSGPNGLAAAIKLAQEGWQVRIYEAKSTVGGSACTQELTLPGFKHDVGAAIQPLGLASPYFKTLPLDQFGLKWIQPPAALAHPLDDGTAVMLYRSISETAERLGQDGRAWERLMHPLVKNWDHIARQFVGPLQIPLHPLSITRFGLNAILPATWLSRLRFSDERAKVLFAGIAAHSFLPLERISSSAAGLLLGVLAHEVGWPMPEGGAQSISDALAGYFESLGGEIVWEHPVTSIDNLPPAKAYLFDVTPRQLLIIAGNRFTPGYRSALENYRYGPGVFKVDYALSDPVPWTAPEVNQAATVHLGATLKEIAISERAIWQGKHAEKPYILLAQHTLFDPTRAPEGKHTLWAYCHVPHGSTVDREEAITNQIERFAPGFRDTILATHTMNTADVEAFNPNHIGGDINGGAATLWQLFARPSLKWRPYRTSAENIFICSASTPPGGGVHGMCGYWAAKTVLNSRF
jgi:phytoene dehydrogenase-like protein